MLEASFSIDSLGVLSQTSGASQIGANTGIGATVQADLTYLNNNKLSLAGGTMTGSMVIPNNAAGIKGTVAGATTHNLVFVNAGDDVTFGHSSFDVIYIDGGTGHSIIMRLGGAEVAHADADGFTLPNDTALSIKDTVGTAYDVVTVTATDKLHLGNGTLDTHVNASVQSFFNIGGSTRADITSSGLRLNYANGRVNEFSTDGTLAGNSDTAVPTEKAVKTYADSIGTGRLLAVTYFSTSGTWNKTAGANTAIVETVGAGGGGGGRDTTNEYGGGGGGAGGYTRDEIDISAISSETVTIGAGGTAGTNSTSPGVGGTGGATTFGAHSTANGGGGGVAGAGGSGRGSRGGAGGTASGANLINASGQDGAPGYRSGFTGGSSGGSGGTTPLGWGKGGVGGYNSTNSEAGEAGYVVVYEYS